MGQSCHFRQPSVPHKALSDQRGCDQGAGTPKPPGALDRPGRRASPISIPPIISRRPSKGGDRSRRDQIHLVNGTPELRKAISAAFKRNNGLDYTPDHITVAAAQADIFNAFSPRSKPATS
jgi:aspartate/methionine/tyrosine aminotransferase